MENFNSTPESRPSRRRVLVVACSFPAHNFGKLSRLLREVRSRFATVSAAVQIKQHRGICHRLANKSWLKVLLADLL